MEGFESFVEGPLLWIAFIIFIAGSLFRLISFFSTASKRDKPIFWYFNLKAVLVTWIKYLLPFNQTVAKNPVFTLMGYVFHICLLSVPLFAVAHLNEWEEGSLELALTESDFWTWMPDTWVPWLSWIVILIGVVFILRRIMLPEVKIISEPSDYFLVVVAVLPFLSGFLASHTAVLGDYGRLIHILTGELWLIVVPFSKLSHWILFFPSRMAMGIEWGRRGYTM